MSDTNAQTNYDEIDLVELISSLWEEKAIVIFTILIFTIFGIIYALNQPSIYAISAQLTPPQPPQLEHLNKTDFFKINSEDAFREFLTVLENNQHIVDVLEVDSALTQSALGFSNGEGLISKINGIRNIKYLSTKKQKTEITPEQYVLILEGSDKTALKRLLEIDLQMAQSKTSSIILQQYTSSLSTEISSINNRIHARKTFLLSIQSDKLLRLENALRIAKELEIELPTSLNKMGLSQTQTEIKINHNEPSEPLDYLRGTRLLQAEINNLKDVSGKIIYDIELRELEAEKASLESVVSSKHKLEITFYVNIFDLPIHPIKPNKKLIVAVYLLIGLMAGLFLAIVRIIYKRSKKHST